MMLSHLFCQSHNGAPSQARSGKTPRRGAAAVEFALVAPLLFMLFLGFVDVGRAIMVKNLLTSAARDGARTATLDGATVAGVQSQVSFFSYGRDDPWSHGQCLARPIGCGANWRPGFRQCDRTF